MKTYRRTVATALLTVGMVASVSACSSSTPSATPSTSSATTHDAADVSFARLILEHHLGAITMASEVASRASSPKVKALGALIEKQQKADLPVIDGLLTSWGLSTSVTYDSSMDGASAADKIAMNEGMTDSEMASLKAARGAAFDKEFLTQMSTHHAGAVAIGASDLASGTSAAARAFAKKVVASQSQQINDMQDLLNSL